MTHDGKPVALTNYLLMNSDVSTNISLKKSVLFKIVNKTIKLFQITNNKQREHYFVHPQYNFICEATISQNFGCTTLSSIMMSYLLKPIQLLNNMFLVAALTCPCADILCNIVWFFIVLLRVYDKHLLMRNLFCE